MKIIDSLDEALYSVMSWLVFYPLTLWRVLVRPLTMMDYASRETADEPARQYEDAIRPPLFLFLTLLLSHGLEIAFAPRNSLLDRQTGLASLVDSDLALLALRLLLFSLFPLMLSTRLLRRQHRPLTHDNLRRPFYGQCYAVAPFAFVLGIGTLMMSGTAAALRLPGAVLALAALLWFVVVQVRWFAARLAGSWLRALGDTLLALGVSIVLFLAVGIAIA